MSRGNDEKQKSYQTLVKDYRELINFMRKLAFSGGIMQFSILIFINAWKHLEFPYYKLVAPVLFSWCFYQFAKDFFTLLKVDRYGSEITLDGILLENKNPYLGKYFHEFLDEFSLIKILLKRSLINFLAIGCLGYFLSQFIIGINLDLAISHGWLVFITGTLTAVVCKFYYDSLKSIAENKLLKANAVRR